MRIAGRNEIDSERGDAGVARCAELQQGVFSASQAGDAGLSRAAVARRIADGRWQRLLPGVYRLRGASPDWKQSLSAALLWAGDAAAVSHSAAGRLWGLDGIRTQAIELIVPNHRAGHLESIKCYRSRTFTPKDVTRREGLRVTTLPRTLIDLAGVLNEEQLEIALDSALRRRLELGWLARRLWQLGRGTPGAGVLRGLVEQRRRRQEHTDSPLEVRLLRLVREARLPEPSLHYDVCEGSLHVAEVDLAWPRQRVALQGDSFANHSNRQAWSGDRDQWSWLASLGWLVLPISSLDVDDRPEEVVRRLRNTLASRRAVL